MRVDLALLFSAALVVRVVPLPWLVDLSLVGDEAFYWDPKGNFTAHPPLWSALLQIPRFFTTEPLAGRALAALVGAATPPLVYLVALRLFDRRTALFAGAIFALYPPHIGFSHYLWSEVLFALLSAGIALALVWRGERPDTRGVLTAAGLAGVALLVKEFAVVLFAGLLGVHWLEARPSRLRVAFLALALFAAPAAVYSIGVSVATGWVFVLSDAPISNLRVTAGLADDYARFDVDERAEKASELLGAVLNRSPAEYLIAFRKQFYNLWTPNSFAAFRLSAAPFPMWRGWSYGLPRSLGVPLARGVFWTTAAVVLLGVLGMCLGPMSPFATFAVISLVVLSATGLLAHEVSRFRLPFMLFFVIFGARLLAWPREAIARARDPYRATIAATLVALYAHVVYVRYGTVGLPG